MESVESKPTWWGSLKRKSLGIFSSIFNKSSSQHIVSPLNIEPLLEDIYLNKRPKITPSPVLNSISEETPQKLEKKDKNDEKETESEKEEISGSIFDFDEYTENQIFPLEENFAMPDEIKARKNLKKSENIEEKIGKNNEKSDTLNKNNKKFRFLSKILRKNNEKSKISSKNNEKTNIFGKNDENIDKKEEKMGKNNKKENNLEKSNFVKEKKHTVIPAKIIENSSVEESKKILQKSVELFRNSPKFLLTFSSRDVAKSTKMPFDEIEGEGNTSDFENKYRKELENSDENNLETRNIIENLIDENQVLRHEVKILKRKFSNQIFPKKSSKRSKKSKKSSKKSKNSKNSKKSKDLKNKSKNEKIEKKNNEKIALKEQNDNADKTYLKLLASIDPSTSSSEFDSSIESVESAEFERGEIKTTETEKSEKENKNKSKKTNSAQKTAKKATKVDFDNIFKSPPKQVKILEKNNISDLLYDGFQNDKNEVKNDVKNGETLNVFDQKSSKNAKIEENLTKNSLNGEKNEFFDKDVEKKAKNEKIINKIQQNIKENDQTNEKSIVENDEKIENLTKKDEKIEILGKKDEKIEILAKKDEKIENLTKNDEKIEILAKKNEKIENLINLTKKDEKIENLTKPQNSIFTFGAPKMEENSPIFDFNKKDKKLQNDEKKSILEVVDLTKNDKTAKKSTEKIEKSPPKNNLEIIPTAKSNLFSENIKTDSASSLTQFSTQSKSAKNSENSENSENNKFMMMVDTSSNEALKNDSKFSMKDQKVQPSLFSTIPEKSLFKPPQNSSDSFTKISNPSNSPQKNTDFHILGKRSKTESRLSFSRNDEKSLKMTPSNFFTLNGTQNGYFTNLTQNTANNQNGQNNQNSGILPNFGQNSTKNSSNTPNTPNFGQNPSKNLSIMPKVTKNTSNNTAFSGETPSQSLWERFGGDKALSSMTPKSNGGLTGKNFEKGSIFGKAAIFNNENNGNNKSPLFADKSKQFKPLSINFTTNRSSNNFSSFGLSQNSAQNSVAKPRLNLNSSKSAFNSAPLTRGSSTGQSSVFKGPSMASFGGAVGRTTRPNAPQPQPQPQPFNPGDISFDKQALMRNLEGRNSNGQKVGRKIYRGRRRFRGRNA